MSFSTADMVISTNESYRSIAIDRGGKNPKDVFVVRSGPDLSRIKPCRESGAAQGRSISSATSESWASRKASTCSCRPFSSSCIT
jgi:hypothetical protein